MNSDYLDLYRVLGVEPGCSWTELKLAYRRLVRRWHPDHREPGTDSGDDAQIKAVNTAFEALSNYYQEHGQLPVPDPLTATGPDPTRTESPPDVETTTPVAERSARTRPTRLQFVIIGAALAVVYAIFANVFNGGDADLRSQRTPASAWNQTAAVPPNGNIPDLASVPKTPPQSTSFGPGSTLGEVIAAQGPPTYMEKNVWHYGNSRVYFRDGRVTHWDEDEANPLHARLLTTETAPSNATTFGVGSTKADVRAAQGTPMLETDTMWDYGASRVNFKDGRVTSWEESPVRPLHLRR